MRTSASALQTYNIIVNETPGRTLGLTKGQLTVGKVLELVDAQHALIELNGQRLLAESKIQLIEGQQIMVQVQGLKQGQLELKLVSVPQELANTGLPLGRLQQVLEGAGLAVSGTNARVVEALLAYNVSPTPENLRTAVILLQQAELGPEGEASVAKLLSYNLNLEPELLLVSHQLEQLDPVPLLKYSQILTQLSNQLPKMHPGSFGLLCGAETPNLSAQLQQLMNNWLVQGPAESLAAGLETVKQSSEVNQLSKLLGEAVQGLQKHFESLNQLQANPIFRENSSLVYLPLPVLINQQAYTGQLFAWKRPKQHQQDQQENHYILLVLQTASLGELKIHLEVKATDLSLRFFVDNPLALKLLNVTTGKLASALEQNGFSVREINSHLVTKRVNRKELSPSVRFSGGVDVTI